MSLSLQTQVTHIPFDILDVVLDRVEHTPDLLSWSLTCSSLRSAALKRLLSRRITLRIMKGMKGKESVRSLHTCIWADRNSPRVQYIRAMEIHFSSALREDELPESQHAETARLVHDILTHAINLSSLTLPMYRYSLSEHPTISAALANLPNLCELSISGQTSSPQELVRSMRSPLRSLTTDFITRGEEILWTPRIYHQFIGHLATTLEVLTLSHLSLNDDSPSKAIRYESLRSLSINIDSTPLLEQLLDWAPAISVLNAPEGCFRLIESEYGDIRSRNLAIQAARGSWKGLRRLVSNPAMLYMLALSCPIQHLVVSSCHARNKIYITEALRGNPVPRLSLTILLKEGLSVFYGLLPPDVQSSLTHLTLCMVSSIGDGHLFHHDPAEITPAAHMEWSTLFVSIQYVSLWHSRIYLTGM